MAQVSFQGMPNSVDHARENVTHVPGTNCHLCARNEPFPGRFGCIEDANEHCARFFDWYHHGHHHSGLGWMTPSDVHHGRAPAVQAKRADALDAAYAIHPERFVRRPPTPPQLPSEVWINKPAAAVAVAGVPQ